MAVTQKTKKSQYPAGVKPGEDVTPGQLAKILKIGRSTVQDWLKSGLVKHDIITPADPNGSQKKIRRVPWSEVLRLRKSSSST